MAFPTTSTVLDNFNRVSIGANWTACFGGGANLNVDGAAVYQTAGFISAFWNPATYGPDLEAWITISTKPTNNDGSNPSCWLIGRAQTPSASTADWYELDVLPAAGTDAWQLYRNINNSFTLLTSGTQEWTNGDKLGLEILGSGATVTINGYRHNGTSWSNFATYSDTDANRITAAGYIGTGISDVSPFPCRLDDFGGGTVSAGGTSRTIDMTGVFSAATAAAVAPPKPRPANPFSEINVRL